MILHNLSRTVKRKGFFLSFFLFLIKEDEGFSEGKKKRIFISIDFNKLIVFNACMICMFLFHILIHSNNKLSFSLYYQP
jgi:hypothetical protein